MTSTSIVYNHLISSVDTLNQVFSTSSLPAQLQAQPTISKCEIETSLKAVNETLGLDIQFQGIPSIDAENLLQISSHVNNSAGSPGTVLIVETNKNSIEANRYEAKVVNRHGQIVSTQLTRCINGWMLEKNPKVYPSFSALTEELLSGMQDILGSLTAIPFLSSSKIDIALSKLVKADPGTYIAFAHVPSQQERAESHLVAPVKRNVLLWVNKDGNIEEAHFHFEPRINKWLNGGPQINPVQVDVPSDETLVGLIQKKMELQGSSSITPIPLNLG
ncbi:MAG: hypothetical protein FJZ57_03030 [Chlamydiae bacterium]|nr:hypothetical protein [Chlamydiota bacterium]